MRNFGKRERRAIFERHKLELDKLTSRGWVYDPDEGRLSYPISIDAKSLATAFREELFDVALQPLADALDKSHDAAPILEPVVAAVRERS